MKKQEVATKMRGAANDKRYNAEKYSRGSKPSKHSEYFGTSYAQMKRQKGRGSLNPAPSKTGKNEGNKMYEGKNEQERM